MYNPLIPNHGVSLPDPAVVFEGKQVVNTNDYPEYYLRLSHAIRIYDKSMFVSNLEKLYQELDSKQTFLYSTHIENQLKKAVSQLVLKQRNDNISYKIKNDQFNDEGYWDTFIDIDDLNKCFKTRYRNVRASSSY